VFPLTKHSGMKKLSRLSVICGLVFFHMSGWCQQNDSLPKFIKGEPDSALQLAPGTKVGKAESPYKVDSLSKKKHDPRKATLYSTFLPGLGQVYNRKYWKLPLVYAAVGIPAYTFFYNKTWYQKCQYALSVVLTGTTNPDSLNKVDPKLKVFITSADASDLISYRNEFRKDQDYSVVFFLLFWGLNIVDATVDAHLMNFDVSSELSMHLEPGPAMPDNAMTGAMNGPPGVSLVFELHKPRYKPINLP
jgi:hypothetical protein